MNHTKATKNKWPQPSIESARVSPQMLRQAYNPSAAPKLLLAPRLGDSWKNQEAEGKRIQPQPQSHFPLAPRLGGSLGEMKNHENGKGKHKWPQPYLRIYFMRSGHGHMVQIFILKRNNQEHWSSQSKVKYSNIQLFKKNADKSWNIDYG